MNDKRYCGIECVFSDVKQTTDFLRLLISHINDGYFCIEDQFVLSKGESTAFPEKLKAGEFRELLTPFVYVLSLVVHLYPSDAQNEWIDTYEDYKKSRCEMIILIYDSAYLEVYCKSIELLDNLFKIAKMSAVTADKIYEDTDDRTCMWV